MRNFGGILLLLGILGFFYASSQMSDLRSAPEGAGQTAAERWDAVRYGCAAAGVVGLLMALFPKGR